jgi:Ca2+-binding EF-hand superfamily protein
LKRSVQIGLDGALADADSRHGSHQLSHGNSVAEALLEASNSTGFRGRLSCVQLAGTISGVEQSEMHVDEIVLDELVELTPELVFSKFQRQGEVTTGPPLVRCFRALNHPYPNLQWLKETIKLLCCGRESLDREDFLDIFKKYEERHIDHLRHIFGNKKVEAQRVPDLLRKCGVPLMMGAAEELLAEISPEVDFPGFRSIYEDVVFRAGLTHREHDRVSVFFEENVDRGLLSVDDIGKCLGFNDNLISIVGGDEIVNAYAREAQKRTKDGTVTLDVSLWGQTVRKIDKKPTLDFMQHHKSEKSADPGSPMSAVPSENLKITFEREGINASAFLACIRMLHERLDVGIREAYAKLGMYCENTVGSSELVSIIEELGMLNAVPDEVEAFVKNLTQQDGASLAYAQAHQLCVQYCQSDGFTESDCQDLADIFNKLDDDNSGFLGADEIGPVIRWLGYQPTHFKMYDFAEEINLKIDSEFDLKGFRAVIAKYRKLNLKGVRPLFLDGRGRDQRLLAEQLPEILQSSGFELTDQEEEAVLKMVSKDVKRTNDPLMCFREFKRYEALHRKHVRERMANNGGFTDVEYKKHHKFFQEHESNGHLSQKSVRTMLADLFPDKGLSKGWHKKIAEMVKEADLDGNGLFDWAEYLILMKTLTAQLERDLLVKGLELKEDLGYNSFELKQFRDLHRACDNDMSGYVDFEELVAVISNLVPMDLESTAELKTMVDAIDNDKNTSLDFWEFLTLMKKIQDMNWRNINGVAGGRNNM